MIDIKRIFPECNADTLLIELLFQRGKPGHFHGISKVAEALKRIDNDTLFTFGLVDSDKFKNTPTYIDEFTIIKEDRSEDCGLILRQRPNTNKHLVFVCPKFEPWIWKQATVCGIDPKIYGFENLFSFYKVSKNNLDHVDPLFKRFVNAVVMKNPPAIAVLKNWLDLSQ